MKLLVLSDIHANHYALEAIWANETGIDAIYCAGDLSDYGTDPKQVIRWMREHNAVVVKGNHDAITVSTYRDTDWKSVNGRDYRWIHHCCHLLDDDDIAYLDSLPDSLSFEADGIAYVMRHQFGPRYETMEMESEFDEFWAKHSAADSPKKRVIFGHTHRRCIHTLADDKLWLNPGSASYRRPDDNDKDAHYAVIEDGVIHLRRCTYDRSGLLKVVQEYADQSAMIEMELGVAFYFFGDEPHPPVPAYYK
ncbi:metallophosphoesterase family protein [Ruminococcaceae bacterium OttesenSCG-928-L11]|nr:metallophosphoesterase family protein [Ruminococcaceae bacterium OttesenSCG-928-L11]